jgi:hypothetical protein
MSTPSPDQVPVVDVGARLDEILAELAAAGIADEDDGWRNTDGRL